MRNYLLLPCMDSGKLCQGCFAGFLGPVAMTYEMRNNSVYESSQSVVEMSWKRCLICIFLRNLIRIEPFFRSRMNHNELVKI